MKKIIIFVVCLFVLPLFALADDITLNSPETLQTPTATRISEWEVTRISAAAKTMQVRYRWRNNVDNVIKLEYNGWNTWTCKDVFEDTNPVKNSQCVSAGDPDVCCTGLKVGSCDDLVQVDSCFSDIFGFNIRAQDVGTSIGAGLRALIWNRMKTDILSGGNDGSFD